MKPINLFFEIPDGDRWLRFDRYPRRVIRSIVRRNQPVAGGYRRSFRELKFGLERLGVPFRLNDYRYIKRHQDELACVYGYPHVLEKFSSDIPILFGAGGYSHPLENPNLLKTNNIKGIIVKGNWMVEMYRPFCGDVVYEWAAPIDVEKWSSPPTLKKDIDLIIYDKVRWDYEHYSKHLIQPIIKFIESRKLTVKTLRYGYYVESQLLDLAQRAKAMIFLCEHETQGLAYQNVLAANVPIFAWDRGGFWQDPKYFPNLVKFEPVSSVPYWDNRCGEKFQDLGQFQTGFDLFFNRVLNNHFSPREFIRQNLTWSDCTNRYLEIVKKVEKCLV